MNMGDLKEAVSVLKYFCRQPTTVNLRTMRDCFLTLKNEGMLNGLTEDTLSVCTEFIEKKCTTSILMQEILKCMIPKRTVPDHVVSCVLLWIKSHFQDGYSRAVVLGLQWVAGLLEFCLTDEKSANQYYYLFLSLLNYKHTEKIASWLVARLTKPNDVDRNAVLKVLDTKKKTSSKNLDIVLWCFKTFKPECVPEPVASYNVLSGLTLPLHLKQCFEKAQQRNAASSDGVQTNLKPYGWDRAWRTSGRRMQHSVDLIPKIKYVYFGSSLYRKKEVSILEITDWKQFSLHMSNIGIPCNVMSLLQNSFGHHLIIFGNETLQHRFSYTLFYTLQNVIIEQIVQVPMAEKEDLLDKICELQEYMQEGIPVVTRFLAAYVPFWDGITFLPQLLRLLPWITFLSFGELNELFLVHLYYMYVSSNVQMKCSLLRALQKLVSNLTVEMDSANEKLFLNSPKVENADDILCNLIHFIKYLCVFGLTVEHGSTLMMNCVLSFYEFVVNTEEKLKFRERSVLPPIAVYSCIFSRNFVNLSRVCDLLLKYDAFHRLTVSSSVVDKRVKLIRKYKNDFVNLLWRNTVFSKRKRGYLFKNIKIENVQEIANFIDVSNPFHIMKYVPITYLWERNSNGDPAKRKKTFLKLFHTVLPTIHNLLNAKLREREESVYT